MTTYRVQLTKIETHRVDVIIELSDELSYELEELEKRSGRHPKSMVVDMAWALIDTDGSGAEWRLTDVDYDQSVARRPELDRSKELQYTPPAEHVETVLSELLFGETKAILL